MMRRLQEHIPYNQQHRYTTKIINVLSHNASFKVISRIKAALKMI